MKSYTDEQKVEALELYDEMGAADAARHVDFEVATGTIRQWAHRAGKSRYSAKKTKAATTATANRAAEKREEVRELLLDRAIDMLLRMDEPHKDFRGKDAREVWWAKAPADASKAYMIAAATAIDKYRLEMGEHTTSAEVKTESDLDRAIRADLDAMARREQAAAEKASLAPDTPTRTDPATD